ncbi:type IX secretion system outer membrane channel protein PorV [Empedobacter falsenii]|uniref:Type IX secretion system outer membrane channel protein PorV n=1 Tax=Empedobacter falsenii TaxID=343874 RepID=A0A7H9DT69_9FLAO|nr:MULTISPECIES: type IX secretion system outer membrane channel protein PorV [Empedobacter]MDH1881197.1 type IX secretion system outer membrane channel protein PorV [Empedobacter sp. GD03797]MDH2208006.1 type IX secretion system outer membrane channel protein PorV [Empedobacter sp. GD03644]MDM1040029.1 type IX secretion system outer membrane channel protein PorV [Empedobacter brevis]MDM1133961.1 type IX secretion system outer membrane channel protein PorV [Empedobacter sp. R750]QLL58408.1 typ
MKKITASLLILASGFTFAQDTGGNDTGNDYTKSNPILTGAPFLRISPDARAGGLGDQGVATSTDNYSQYWNAAKYAFAPDYSGVAFTYTPYMGSLVNDVFLLNATYYTFLGQDERSTLGASIYYFNMGEIELNQLQGTDIVSMGKAKPNEFSIDLSYGLRLTDNYSMAVTGRFIRSDLFNGVSDGTVQPANTFAVDLAGYYQSETMDTNNFEGKLRGGFQISNIGPKLDYSNSEDNASYLPTTLRLGVGYDFKFDDYNKVGITTEFSKLLVPTPTYEKDENGNPIPGTGYIPNKGVMSGIFSSFGDAPGGGKEELKEIMYSVGAEYSYNDALFIRAGYFHESPMKGDRQHLTLGLGLKYNAFAFNASYLIPMSDTNNALENTLRFGIAWNFGGETQNNYDY